MVENEHDLVFFLRQTDCLYWAKMHYNPLIMDNSNMHVLGVGVKDNSNPKTKDEKIITSNTPCSRHLKNNNLIACS